MNFLYLIIGILIGLIIRTIVKDAHEKKEIKVQKVSDFIDNWEKAVDHVVHRGYVKVFYRKEDYEEARKALESHRAYRDEISVDLLLKYFKTRMKSPNPEMVPVMEAYGWYGIDDFVFCDEDCSIVVTKPPKLL